MTSVIINLNFIFLFFLVFVLFKYFSSSKICVDKAALHSVMFLCITSVHVSPALKSTIHNRTAQDYL